MTDLDMWSLLVGLALPALIAVVNRSHWPSWVRALVAVATSVVAGGGTAYLTGQLTAVTWVHAALVVAVAAVGSYRLWWHPSGIAPAIEAHINP